MKTALGLLPFTMPKLAVAVNISGEGLAERMKLTAARKGRSDVIDRPKPTDPAIDG